MKNSSDNKNNKDVGNEGLADVISRFKRDLSTWIEEEQGYEKNRKIFGESSADNNLTAFLTVRTWFEQNDI